MRVEFREMRAADAVQLELQAGQHEEFGLWEPRLDMARGRELVASGPAWTAIAGDRIVAIGGFAEQFGGATAVAWIMLATGAGRHALALTRYVRRRIEAAAYWRLECIVEADKPKAIAFAKAVGFEPDPYPLRRFGQNSKLHYLFERIA